MVLRIVVGLLHFRVLVWGIHGQVLVGMLGVHGRLLMRVICGCMEWCLGGCWKG